MPPCLRRIGEDRCTGCAACANGCDQMAIDIMLTPEGFYRPVLQKESCNGCKACVQSCPVIAAEEATRDTDGEPDVFAAWSNDPDIHISSSSGGLFSELAHLVLMCGGVVCGCEWGDNWTPRHVIVKKWEDVSRLRGSKYLPSLVGANFYRNIIDLAGSGAIVLFCGTPCQVAALDRLCPPRVRENLLLVDLVCHGVPSLTSFWSYLDWKFRKSDSLAHFSFRNKELCTQTICAVQKNGSKYLVAAGEDPWFRAVMVYHWFLQSICFECPFGGRHRYGDITLGDFWGIPEKWSDPKGDSVVLANTGKGKSAMRELIESGRIRVKASDYHSASRNIRRLRGAVYPVSLLRPLALRWTATGKSFRRIYALFYLPTRFRERIAGYALKLLRLISMLPCKPWGRR